MSPGLAAIFGISSGLGYLLPAIIGLESMGVPSPGETALVLAAILASQGKLNIVLVILIGSVSAIMGDNIGYLLGRRFGRELATRMGGALVLEPDEGPGARFTLSLPAARAPEEDPVAVG